MEHTEKLAVLIDADNAQPSIIDALLAEIAKYGTASVKRIYGDWTLPQLKGWKEVLLTHSIQPIQQFGYTSGKNATDSAMIIDAMDLLYTGNFDGFCIVSSDSDFTKLAARIRESGLTVYGFGEKKTPTPFVSACDKFIFTEVLRAEEVGEETAVPIKRLTAAELKRDRKLIRLLRDAADAASDESGWAHLGTMGSIIAKQSPEFDPRNYGYKKLGELVKATGLFDIEEQVTHRGAKAIYVRNRRYAKSVTSSRNL
ncbi:maebl [Hydrogenimonas sp.]|nr:maebl [Hydrogenimonas sp.]